MGGSFLDQHGNPIDVPGLNPSDFVQGGGRVALVRPDGTGVTVPVESLRQALEMGYQPESAAHHEERRLEQKYGDSPLRTAIESAAGTATLGLSDAALSAFDAEGLRERRRLNPTAALVGGIGGAFLPTGAGAIAGSLGHATAGALAGTEALEGLAGGGVLARAAARAVPTLAQGATEGAVFGFGEGVSHVALSENPMSAEAIAGKLGSSALYGAGAGLAAGSLGLLAKQAGAAMKTGADRLIDHLSVDGTTDALGAASGDVSQMGLDTLRAARAQELEAVKTSRVVDNGQAGQQLAEYRTSVEPLTADTATSMRGNEDANVFRDTQRQLMAFPGERLQAEPASALPLVRKQGEALAALSETFGGKTLEDAVGRNRDLEDRLSSLAAEPSSARLGAIDERIDQLTRAAKAAVPDDIAKMGKDAVKAARAKELDALTAQRAAQAQQLALDINAFREEYRPFGIQLNAALPDKAGLGRLVNSTERRLETAVGNMDALAEDPGKALDALQRQRQALEQIVKPRLPSDDLDAVLAKNADLRARIQAFKAPLTSPTLESLDARLEQLKTGTAADHIGELVHQKMIGGLIGAAAGAVFGHGAIGAMLGGTVAELAGKALKRRLFSSVADMSSVIQAGVNKMMTGAASLGRAIDTAPRAAGAGAELLGSVQFGNASPGAAQTEASGEGRGDFARVSAQLAAAAADPNATRGTVRENLQSIRAVDPKLADQVEDQAMQRVAFLASKMPRSPFVGVPGDRWQPSDFQLSSFARSVAAAENPSQLIDEMATGHVSRETVEATKALYPVTFAKVQEAMTLRLSDATVADRLPYTTRLTLAKVFGLQTEPSLRPDFVARIQSVYQRAPVQPPKPPQRAPVPQEPTMGQRFSGG
jgi:hypothetical protein